MIERLLERGSRSEHHDARRRHRAHDGGADRQCRGGDARCCVAARDVNAARSWKGQTALMWAAAANNAAAVEALVEAGADVQARARSISTVAAGYQTGGFGRRAERNSDVTKQAGFTALHFAVRAGAIDASRRCLKAGATLQRHDLGWDGCAGAGDREHALRARRLAARAGRRSECRRPGLDAASSNRVHAKAQHRRQQSWAGAERSSSTA